MCECPPRTRNAASAYDAACSNEFAPTIVSGPAELQVSEAHATPAVVARYQSTDADASPSEPSWFVSPPNVGFTMQPAPGGVGELVMVAAPDYDAGVRLIVLTITAVDDGFPTARFDSTELRITVVEANDEAPRFTEVRPCRCPGVWGTVLIRAAGLGEQRAARHLQSMGTRRDSSA